MLRSSFSIALFTVVEAYDWDSVHEFGGGFDSFDGEGFSNEKCIDDYEWSVTEEACVSKKKPICLEHMQWSESERRCVEGEYIPLNPSGKVEEEFDDPLYDPLPECPVNFEWSEGEETCISK